MILAEALQSGQRAFAKECSLLSICVSLTAHMAASLPVLKPGSSTHYAMLDLQNDAAVFRTQETLENGCKDIDECVASFEDVGIQDRSMVWNTDLCETLELENLLTNAAVTMHSAEARKVSLTAGLLTSYLYKLVPRRCCSLLLVLNLTACYDIPRKREGFIWCCMIWPNGVNHTKLHHDIARRDHTHCVLPIVFLCSSLRRCTKGRAQGFHTSVCPAVTRVCLVRVRARMCVCVCVCVCVTDETDSV